MKTQVWVTFNYGGWYLAFSKVFELGFTPFPGLVLFDDSVDGHEHQVEFVDNDYTTTMIHYKVSDKSFLVDVRNVWKHPVTEETIDYEIENYARFGWIREDRTDIPALKELMNRNAKR